VKNIYNNWSPRRQPGDPYTELSSSFSWLGGRKIYLYQSYQSYQSW